MNPKQRILFLHEVECQAKLATPANGYRAALIMGVIRGEAAKGNDLAAFLALEQLRDLLAPDPSHREHLRRRMVDIGAGRWFDYIELASKCEDWVRETLRLTGTNDLDRKARACAEAFGHPEWCDDPNHPVWHVMRAIAALMEKDYAHQDEEAEQGRPAAVRPTTRR